MANENKKNKPKGILVIFLMIVFIVWWLNNYTLKTTDVEIYSKKIKEPVKIAVIGDVHASSFGISNKRIIEKIENGKPDIIVILGDMYTLGSDDKKKDLALELMYGIREKNERVYFVPGEHDNDAVYKQKLSEHGIKVMDYKNEIINVNGNKLHMIGIDNAYYTETFDLTREFMIEDDCFNILMAHIPNYEKFSAFGADLTLCADTHGELFQLPFDNGPLYSSSEQTFFPEMNGSVVYDKGLFPYKGGTMFITSGIGASPYPLRFNNRPEVVMIELDT